MLHGWWQFPHQRTLKQYSLIFGEIKQHGLCSGDPSKAHDSQNSPDSFPTLPSNPLLRHILFNISYIYAATPLLVWNSCTITFLIGVGDLVACSLITSKLNKSPGVVRTIKVAFLPTELFYSPGFGLLPSIRICRQKDLFSPTPETSHWSLSQNSWWFRTWTGKMEVFKVSFVRGNGPNGRKAI